MERTIRIERYLAYKKEIVWKALTDAETFGSWFMPNNLEPEPGYEFTFRKPPQPGWDGIIYCKVIALEPMNYIAYTYCGEAGGEKALACAGIESGMADKAVKGIFTQLDTILSFSLAEEGNGTRLILEHTGFRGFKLVIVSLIMGMGWKKLMKKLEVTLRDLNKI